MWRPLRYAWPWPQILATTTSSRTVVSWDTCWLKLLPLPVGSQFDTKINVNKNQLQNKVRLFQAASKFFGARETNGWTGGKVAKTEGTVGEGGLSGATSGHRLQCKTSVQPQPASTSQGHLWTKHFSLLLFFCDRQPSGWRPGDALHQRTGLSGSRQA